MVHAKMAISNKVLKLSGLQFTYRRESWLTESPLETFLFFGVFVVVVIVLFVVFLLLFFFLRGKL
jgi:hypothetical protein